MIAFWIAVGDDVPMLSFEKLSPAARTALRLAVALVLTFVAGFTAIAMFFVGGIELTGCFIECSEPNPIGGSLLMAGAVVAASATVTALVWGAIGWNAPVLRRVAATTGALSAGLALLYAFAV